MYFCILKYMDKLDITFKDLAKQMNVDQEYLLKRLEGKYPFTLDEAWKLKNLLQMEESIETIFSFFIDKM